MVGNEEGSAIEATFASGGARRRRRGIALGALGLFLAVSGEALATPPPEKRIAAIIIPMDKTAEQLTLRIEGYAADAIKEFDGFKLKTSDQLFGLAPDEDAAAALKRAEQAVTEGRAAFDARNYEAAERKARAAIKDFEHAAPAMKSCGNLCEAVAMYASALQERGDIEEAKVTLLDLLALAPSHELDRQRYAPSFLALKAQVAASRNAQLRGNVNVRSRPAGARVHLNGAFQCYSPCTLSTLPIGRALVRLERPGFRQAGQLVEVTPEDQQLDLELVATAGYKAFDGLMDKLAGEALKDKGGATMDSVASSLKLDRAIVGVLRDLDGKSELILGYFDLKGGRRFSTKRATFQGDEFGQLQGEIGRMVNSLLNFESSEKASRAGDPLLGRRGTEDWSSEDRGGRGQERDKKKSGDPLKGVSGTEDW